MTDRGEQYADGGTGANDRVHHPNPVRMARINQAWADAEIGVPIDLTPCHTCNGWTRYEGDGKVCPDCD